VRIADSAHRHDIADDDIRHALRNAVWHVTQDDVVIVIGPARNGARLEIGVHHPAEGPVVIHAMPVRCEFDPYM